MLNRTMKSFIVINTTLKKQLHDVTLSETFLLADVVYLLDNILTAYKRETLPVAFASFLLWFACAYFLRCRWLRRWSFCSRRNSCHRRFLFSLILILLWNGSRKAYRITHSCKYYKVLRITWTYLLSSFLVHSNHVF